MPEYQHVPTIIAESANFISCEDKTLQKPDQNLNPNQCKSHLSAIIQHCRTKISKDNPPDHLTACPDENLRNLTGFASNDNAFFDNLRTSLEQISAEQGFMNSTTANPSARSDHQRTNLHQPFISIPERFRNLQDELTAFAQKHGLRYIPVPTEAKEILEQFTALEWDKKRKRGIMRAERRLIRGMQGLKQIENLLEKDIITFEEFIAMRSLIQNLMLESPSLALYFEEIDLALCEMLQGDQNEQLRSFIKLRCDGVKSAFRYQLEAEEDTYASGRFTVDFFAKIAGFPEAGNIFWDETAKRRTIADLGCGNGDLLIELARCFRREARGRLFYFTMMDVLRDHNVNLRFNSQDEIDQYLKKFLSRLHNYDIDFRLAHEPTDSHFIGIDQAQIFLEKLQSPLYGIQTHTANISAPFEEFQTQTGIQESSIDIATSTLTLDRADPEGLIENISRILKPNGRFVLANKSVIEAVSDGQTNQTSGNSIQYHQNTRLSAHTPSQTLEKLMELLQEKGLQATHVGCYPYQVISTDCDPINGEPQNYELVVVGGCKIK